MSENHAVLTQKLRIEVLAKIVSFINQAGGVGKTTLTANIGYHIAKKGARVLLVDMDPQASLTRQFRHNPRELQHTIVNTLVNGDEMPILVGKDNTDSGWNDIDLIPTNKNLIVIDRLLAQVSGRENRLRESLHPLRKHYDFILIDSPPSLGLMSLMSLAASTHALIPIKASDKAMEGAEDLSDTLSIVIKKVNKRLRIAGAVPMMVDKRKIIHKTTDEEIRRAFKKYTVHPSIPESTDFEKSWRARKPLAKIAPKHPAIESLDKIAAYLEQCS